MPSSARTEADSATIPDVNVVVFGAAGVGKSALVRRFLQDSFSDIYQPTIEKTFSTVLQTLNGSCVRLVLIDTAGLHSFPAMRELRMRTANIFLFVFSYDSPDSLDEAIRLFFELKRVKADTFDPSGIIFVGNKTDLLNTSIASESSWAKTPSSDNITDYASLQSNSSSSSTSSSSSSATYTTVCHEVFEKSKASILGQLDCQLIETSARLGTNVLELFHSALWPVICNMPAFCPSPNRNRLTVFPFDEDSPPPQLETTITKNKISWSRREASDHPSVVSLGSSCSPGRRPLSVALQPQQSDRRRKMSCIENAMLTGGHLFAPKDDSVRKLSIGSRLCQRKNRHLAVTDDPFNRPASRSHSVDNSLVKQSGAFRDSNANCSTYSDRSYSSIGSIEKDIFRKLSVQSDQRSRFRRFFTPSPHRTSREDNYNCLSEISPFTLNFVKEVGHFLDPSHNSDDGGGDTRVPQAPFIPATIRSRRRSAKAQWEQIKIPVFSTSNSYCLDEHMHESTSPRSEHEFNLVVPDLVCKPISRVEPIEKSPTCRII